MSAMQVLVFPVPVAMASKHRACPRTIAGFDGVDGVLLVGAQGEPVVEGFGGELLVRRGFIPLEQGSEALRCVPAIERVPRFSGRRRSQNQMPLCVASCRRKGRPLEEKTKGRRNSPPGPQFSAGMLVSSVGEKPRL